MGEIRTQLNAYAPSVTVRDGQVLVGEGKRDADAIRKPTIVGNGCRFERIRRITGYLVGTLKRFNNAKAQEERDRVKHG